MIRTLALLCGFLIAVVAAEVTVFDSNTEALAVSTPITPPTISHAGPPVPSRSELLTIILGRPLFAPDRKPFGDARPLADAGLPRLSGIIAGANQSLAIFESSVNVKPIVARSGETVGGWQVMDIALGEVTLRKADDSIRVTPQFAGGGTGGRVTTVVKRTRWEAAAATGLLRARWSNPQLQP
jgi:hypothetical protein